MRLTVVKSNLDRWAELKSEFWSAKEKFVPLRVCYMNDEICDLEALKSARQELHLNTRKLAGFLSCDPEIVDDKHKIAAALMHLSSGLDECDLEGLADDIIASTAELPDHYTSRSVDHLFTPAFRPSWRYAVDFWDAVNTLKPLGSPALLVRRTHPVTLETFADKVLITAFLGVLRLQAAEYVDGGISISQTWMNRLMAVTSDDCLAAIADQRPYDEMLKAVRISIQNNEIAGSALVRLLLSLSPMEWIHQIWADALALGLVIKQHRHRQEPLS